MPSFDAIVSFLGHSTTGSIASVVGLMLTAVGFWITLVTLRRTRGAADAARAAAELSLKKLSRLDAVTECARAIEILDELQRLHRAGGWQTVLDRYSVAKRLIISVKVALPTLPLDQQSLLQDAIGQLTTMQKTVEKSIEQNGTLRSSEMNRHVARLIDNLARVLAHIRYSTVGDSDERE